jgi:hypothetical protein
VPRQTSCIEQFTGALELCSQRRLVARCAVHNVSAMDYEVRSS